MAHCPADHQGWPEDDPVKAAGTERFLGQPFRAVVFVGGVGAAAQGGDHHHFPHAGLPGGFEIAPGGQKRFDQLKYLLAGSGIEVRQKAR